MSIHLTVDDINNMTDSEILALGSPIINIHTEEKTNKTISPYIYVYETEHNYSLITTTSNEADIIGKDELTLEEALWSVVHITNKSQCVGKLVTGITNSLYSGKYRIIGYDHDGSSNTFDLITEDCVATKVFGSSNRHYNDSNCTARKYVEDTFYSAFSSDVKSHIKPMEVKYYYKTTTGRTGGTLQTNTAYCKLLSFNEIGYGTSGPTEYSYSPGEADEGNLYPYYNNTTNSLRKKKYNVSATSWWLRSRVTNNSSYAGIILGDGTPSSLHYGNTHGIAPVIRIG